MNCLRTAALACLVAATLSVNALAVSARETDPPPNMARYAVATASEVHQDLTPEKARDGDLGTRWSGIPGHNRDVWFQLDWERPVRVAEVVIHQFDRFVMELDVQVWDGARGDWRTMQHSGAPDKRLPSVVVCRFDAVETTRNRIGNITNGPSFTEVEVYSQPFAGGLETRLASDLRGNLIGIVTDSFGAEGHRHDAPPSWIRWPRPASRTRGRRR